MTRLVDERGWIMNGGAAQRRQRRRDGVEPLLHDLAGAQRSVPRSKSSRMSESWGTDFERIVVDARHPLKRLLQGDGDQLFGLLRREPEA